MTRNIGLLAQIPFICVSFPVCSGKSQLSNYVMSYYTLIKRAFQMSHISTVG